MGEADFGPIVTGFQMEEQLVLLSLLEWRSRLRDTRVSHQTHASTALFSSWHPLPRIHTALLPKTRPSHSCRFYRVNRLECTEKASSGESMSFRLSTHSQRWFEGRGCDDASARHVCQHDDSLILCSPFLSIKRVCRARSDGGDLMSWIAGIPKA